LKPKTGRVFELRRYLDGSRLNSRIAFISFIPALQLERFPIRAADALHLGAALIWCNQKPRGRLFVCNDRRLGDAARQSGFTVDTV